MNFLAHIFLSEKKPHLVVGNFLADFIKNRDVSRLPRPVQEGIRMHRKIDSFTDSHPIVRQSVLRLRPKHGKFAPVVLDICFDYLLVKNWDRYSDEDIHYFTKETYAILEEHAYLMPHFLQERLPHMVADDWLVKYGSEKGLRYVFERMKKRTRFPEYFDGAVDSFFRDYDLYEKEFNLFFPNLIDAVKNWEERSE